MPFFDVRHKTKSCQCNKLTSFKLVSFGGPLFYGNNVVTEETIIYFVQDKYNERISKRTFNKFWISKVWAEL